MYKGEIDFRADFSGIEFESIEIVPFSPKVPKITLKSSEEGISLKIEIANAESSKEVICEAEKTAKHLAKILTFKSGSYHQDFKIVQKNLMQELPDGTNRMITYVVGMTEHLCNVRTSLVIKPDKLPQFKSSIQKISQNQSPYYDLFYFALGLQDPIAKFMVLYNIALDLCKRQNSKTQEWEEKQKYVDEFILSIRPNVPVYSFQRKDSIISETIYTKLRNQVGHTRPDTNLEETRNEMVTNLNPFISIISELISQKISNV
ncbi:hypothetical protein H6G89_23535 [Oscillatoria sp. FACHB-1407]|uniref:hypothetical protein n=1 Tax=Oscillatoria sp. FACHB-1407 TaxID=2692847 RepID=UPI001686EBDE|nr:hypothetical protein [Oscillatoria sp. FACHB-1407]MBD2463979.1 hypothetical protein [Oscillatoria sp. FACHB-1407]